MLFFINEQGTTVNLISEAVYQGSTNVNELVLVAPIAQANQVTAVLRLPNGVTPSPYLMTLQTQQLVINNKTYQIYKSLIDGNVTAYNGICKVQFKIYQGASLLTTYTSNFTISEGVLDSLPVTPSNDVINAVTRC